MRFHHFYNRCTSEMELMTMISRVIDGLLLAATMDEEQNAELNDYKAQAKKIFKQLTAASPSRCTIETHGSHIFHYMIENGVCYLTLASHNYAKPMAFAYLEELSKEFQAKHGNEVATVARPYAFIGFDSSIQRIRKGYLDTRKASSNLHKLNDELKDVQRYMMQNIEDVIGRGEQISVLSDRAESLKATSKEYLKDTKALRWQLVYRKYAPLIALLFIFFLFIYAWLFI